MQSQPLKLSFFASPSISTQGADNFRMSLLFQIFKDLIKFNDSISVITVNLR